MDSLTAKSFNLILQTPIAEDGDRMSNGLPVGHENDTDTSASSRFGFPKIFSRSIKTAGGKPIQRDEMNSLLNVLSRQITYFQMGGNATWNADANVVYNGYPPNAIVWHEGKQYRNILGSANTSEPGTTFANGWQQCGPVTSTGTESIAAQSLCPNTKEIRQLIDWTNTMASVSGMPTGFLPVGHVDEADDNGNAVSAGNAVYLKESWWNYQNVMFLTYTSPSPSAPNVTFNMVPSVYLYMGLQFKGRNESLGSSRLASYRWGLENPMKTTIFDENVLYVDLSKTFTTTQFTLGGGGYLLGVYGIGDCSALR